MQGRRPRLSLLMAIGTVLLAPHAAIAAQPGEVGASPFSRTTNELCLQGQRLTAGVSLPVRNIVHDDYDSFVKSKPAVQPLETQQYVEYADGDRARPIRVSCKFKSTDHIRAVHGPAAASGRDDPNACRELNRTIVLAVYRDLPAPERGRVAVPPQRFMLDGDEVRIMGSAWTEPFQFAYAGADGRVHLRSKALMVMWDDWRWKLAPDRFRGTHYCHLAAPEYVRDLMLGRSRAPPPAPAGE